jgi:hypothetical protein
MGPVIFNARPRIAKSNKIQHNNPKVDSVGCSRVRVKPTNTEFMWIKFNNNIYH